MKKSLISAILLALIIILLVACARETNEPEIAANGEAAYTGTPEPDVYEAADETADPEDAADETQGEVTLDSRQVPGMTFNYVRWEGDFVPYEPPDLTGHPLIGTWAWDGGMSYLYVFNADGTGTRGFPGQIEDINWYAYDDHLLMETSVGLESWTFTIDGDVLTIDNRHAELVWSYIRQ